MGGCRRSDHEKAKDAQKPQEETSSHNGPFSAPWGEGGTSWNQSRENSLRLWLEIANGFFRPLPPQLDSRAYPRSGAFHVTIYRHSRSTSRNTYTSG
jgi:hypothetical protein